MDVGSNGNLPWVSPRTVNVAPSGAGRVHVEVEDPISAGQEYYYRLKVELAP